MPIYQCDDANPCGWQVELSEDNAELKQRIAALAVENAALKTELTDTKRKTANLRETNRALMERASRRKAQVNKMQRERDALRGDVRNSDHVVALDFRIAALTAELNTARQSRARLVAHVRRLRAKFSETMPDSAYVKHITDERDAARAWAAAWKQAAHMHRQYQDGFGYIGDSISAKRRARRAAEAAEAQERR